MTSKLSDLVDNLSEIYKKECKGRMERKKIKSLCDFIGLKNNKYYSVKMQQKMFNVNKWIN